MIEFHVLSILGFGRRSLQRKKNTIHFKYSHSFSACQTFLTSQNQYLVFLSRLRQNKCCTKCALMRILGEAQHNEPRFVVSLLEFLSNSQQSCGLVKIINSHYFCFAFYSLLLLAIKLHFGFLQLSNLLVKLM